MNSLVWIIGGWLAGVAAGLANDMPLLSLGTGFGLALILTIAQWLYRRNKFIAPFTLLLVLSLAAGAFWSTTFKLSENPVLSRWQGQQVELIGQVASPVKSYPNRQVFLVRVEGLKENGMVQKVNELTEVIIYRDNNLHKLEIPYGGQVGLRGQVRVPSGARNPGEFDYSQYLANQRIYSQVILAGEPVILAAGSKFSPLSLAADYKEKSIELFRKHLPGREGSILAAMTFGWREGLTEEDKDLFAKAGLMHLFAVSGLHMGFVLVTGLWLAGRLKMSRYPPIMLVILMTILLGFYAAMADFSVSALRAAIMGLIGTVAMAWQRRKDFYTAFALAAFLLTLVNPFYLWQVGFQLSFTAAWGIVFFYPALQRLMSGSFAWDNHYSDDGRQFRQAWWKNMLIVPVAAQIAVLPLLAYYFNLVSLLGIAANVISLWLAGGAVLTGLVIFPVGVVLPPLGEILLIAVGGGLYFLTELLELMVRLPGAFTIVKTPSLFAIGLYYAAVIYLAGWLKGDLERLTRPWLRWQYPRFSKLAGVALLALTLAAWNFPSPADQLTVTVLDVGQGDAIVVTLPNGRNLLIDGGGIPVRPGSSGYDVGEKVVLPYLQRQGIKKIELLVNTHGHYDHVAGLIPVVQELPVGKALLSPVPATSNTYEKFLELLDKKDIPIIYAERGQLINLDPRVELKVLHPGNPVIQSTSQLNDNSVVFKLSYGQFSMLFTGDIEQAAIADLLASELDLSSTVYKVAHHGSSTGLVPEFLERVNPGAGVICVGKNTFGHPSENLINHLGERGVLIYRTDLDGGIVITTDGNKVKIISTR
ncbi:MAG: DNA internalization-related competence protein ComEC/Rec2 [Clostridia bacterium]|nr:DNA internalization-related competence protein ComEC/Rec2 [Clostridia bacterium]